MQIGLAARDYDDRDMQADQMAGYYLDRCVAILDIEEAPLNIPQPAAGLPGSGS